MKLFDTHAHIGLIHDDPIEQMIICKEARQSGVEHLISICNNLKDFARVYENLSSTPQVYHAIGVSPSEVAHPGKDWELRILEGAKLKGVVAVGEIGLDYYRRFGDRDSQIELFIQQLEIAEKLDLPVIIHNRNAGRDVLEILQEKLPSRGGVLHCYSEDWDYAQKALELPLRISFAGNVTYRNARNLHEVAKKMPLDRLLIESESPFMVPAQYRGKRNKPTYLQATADFIAEIRQTAPQEIHEATYNNAETLFMAQEA